jgi:hypothetical protein
VPRNLIGSNPIGYEREKQLQLALVIIQISREGEERRTPQSTNPDAGPYYLL